MATMVINTEAKAHAELSDRVKDGGVANRAVQVPAISQRQTSLNPREDSGCKPRQRGWAMANILRKTRTSQVRLFAFLLAYIGRVSAGRSAVLFMRSLGPLRWLLEGLLGYRRSFTSFDEAKRCSRQFISAGHEHEDDIRMHLSSSRAARESDYAVLFYLSQSEQLVRRVFDFGGNIGNLFYCYQNYLEFPQDTCWNVYELAEIRAAGERLAAERGESRIHYVDTIDKAEGADLFLASGSLHYFESPLPELLAKVQRLPARVIVNRTPFSEAGDVITVQDAGTYLVPCKLHDKQKFLDGMAFLGYKLRASWPVAERALYVPLHPDCSSQTYFGFYFELMYQ